MPLQHYFFPNKILEGGSFEPYDPPGFAPVHTRPQLCLNSCNNKNDITI